MRGLQFTLLTADEAKKFLAGCGQTIDNAGDRIAASRRLKPVTTALERTSSRAYNRRREREIAKYGSVEAFRAALAMQVLGTQGEPAPRAPTSVNVE